MGRWKRKKSIKGICQTSEDGKRMSKGEGGRRRCGVDTGKAERRWEERGDVRDEERDSSALGGMGVEEGIRRRGREERWGRRVGCRGEIDIGGGNRRQVEGRARRADIRGRRSTSEKGKMASEEEDRR